eukprot:TRINITY_DN1835_c0_g1_i2.p1 TRINITY_DN1835_c0_g1~~TRINITY_DN1835_c0_g1_i2.p1  ORF type:complete len:109 (+),score=12.58 TRINITY_DN1835_c0_g1_i2:227-553(+)
MRRRIKLDTILFLFFVALLDLIYVNDCAQSSTVFVTNAKFHLLVKVVEKLDVESSLPLLECLSLDTVSFLRSVKNIVSFAKLGKSMFIRKDESPKFPKIKRKRQVRRH